MAPGANFGIATSLEFDLHPFSGTLHRGVHIHPATDIHELWSTFREFAASAPDTIATIFTVALAEPAADYPDAVAGRPIVVISYNHSGAGEDVERDVAPLLDGSRSRRQRHGTSEHYLEAQRSSDLTLDWGSRSFILGGYVADCPPAVLDAFVGHVAQVPGDSSISVTAMGGAIGRVPTRRGRTRVAGGHSTSAPTRHGPTRPRRGERDVGPRRDGDRRTRSRPGPLHQRAVRRRSRDDARAATATRSSSASRELKRAWDPTNVFRLNHNIEALGRAPRRNCVVGGVRGREALLERERVGRRSVRRQTIQSRERLLGGRQRAGELPPEHGVRPT